MTRLQTQRLTLRPIQPRDAGAIFEIYSSPAVCEFFDLRPFEEASQAERHVARWIRLADEGRQFRHAIIHAAHVIGTCGIYAVNTAHGRASIGCDLLPAYWDRGLMSEALREYLPFVFREHGLSRLQGLAMPNNGASVRLLEKLGFRHEGVLRNYERWDGKGHVDLAMYALLSEDGAG
ncbi:MAG: GNAT family N-acetyltransferase [Myxococcota bacterium]